MAKLFLNLLNVPGDEAYEVRDRVEKQGKDYFGQVVSGQSFDDPFLVEMNWRLDEDFNFVTRSGIAYSFESDSNADQLRRVRAWFDGLEEDLGDCQDPDTLLRLLGG